MIKSALPPLIYLLQSAIAMLTTTMDSGSAENAGAICCRVQILTNAVSS